MKEIVGMLEADDEWNDVFFEEETDKKGKWIEKVVSLPSY